jgi:hypothetical protein
MVDKKRNVSYVFAFNDSVTVDFMITSLVKVISYYWRESDIDVKCEINEKNNKASIITTYRGKIKNINRRIAKILLNNEGEIISVERKKYSRCQII